MTDTNTPLPTSDEIGRVCRGSCVLGATGCAFVMFYALKVNFLTPNINLYSGIAMIAFAIAFIIFCKYAKKQITAKENPVNEQKN